MFKALVRIKGETMHKIVIALMLFVFFAFPGLIASQAHSEVASCQTDDQGTITSCMEFASGKSIPGPMEKICGKGGATNVKWFKNPCPRAGTIGYCEVPRNDTITQVVYCYKKHGMPDKQKLGFCKQACKGRFAAY
jgi:hypothetical protein